MDERRERLALLAGGIGLDPAAVSSAEPRLSWSNDVWILDHPVHGRCALRICTLGRRTRLTTEAMLGRELPAAIGYPPVLEFGETAGYTWQLTAWLPGVPLATAWPDLDQPQRVEAGADLGHRLRALHAVRPSPATTAGLLSTLGEDLIGDTALPFPPARALALLDRSAFDSSVRAEVAGLLGSAAALVPRFDDPRLAVVHSDPHLFNVWWHDGAVRGLMDLEYARFGPPWVDLARLSCLWLEDELAGRDDYRPLITGLLGSYPDLAGVDHLEQRLRLCVVAYEVRDSLISGATAEAAGMIQRALSGPMLPPI